MVSKEFVQDKLNLGCLYDISLGCSTGDWLNESEPRKEVPD